ncbi:MAG: DUF1934 domain-containing protein [Clostridia bacterium]
MKIPINITLTSKTAFGSEKNNNSPVITEGTAVGYIKKTKKGLVLECPDILSQLPSNIPMTFSIINDRIVTVNQLGLYNGYMVFEQGKSHICVYDVPPYPPVQLCVQTNTLKNNITQLGGKMEIDYTVSVVGTIAEHSHVTMSVSPHESVMTS